MDDLKRLVKCMELTASDNDNEALLALRRANDIRLRLNKTWAELLEPPIFPSMQVTIRPHGMQQTAPWAGQKDGEWTPPHLTDKPTIAMMFRKVFETPRVGSEDFWAFMDSIYARFNKHGNLTQNQYNALRRSYSRVMGRGAR